MYSIDKHVSFYVLGFILESLEVVTVEASGEAASSSKHRSLILISRREGECDGSSGGVLLTVQPNFGVAGP